MKNCPNCLKDFEPNSGKQKFCSDKCKVAFARKSAKEIKGVTTADKVKSFSNGGTMLDQINIDNKKAEWIKEVKDYCSNEGIIPEDLILSHKERNKPKKSKSGTEVSKNEERPKFSPNEGNASYFMSDLRKKKCGL